MSETLDFSELTDDQIVELASALAQEALRRRPAVAAAFEQAMLTERERAEAAMRGAKLGKERLRREIEDTHRRAAHEQAAEELRQRRHQALSAFLGRAAQITDRELHDVTLVWSGLYSQQGPHLYLNAGASGEEVTWHLVDYCPKGESLRVSWALENRKAELLQWAREAVATLRALRVQSIVLKGIEL